MSTAGRVHRIKDDDVVPVTAQKPKPAGGGTPVDITTTTVMPPGVRPANSWDAMLDQLPPQSIL